MALLKLTKRDRNNKLREVGSIEIKNQTENSADLCFFGDINSESLGEWQKYYPEDKAPQDVKEFLDQLENVSKINLVTPDVEIITKLTNILTNIKSINQKVDTINISLEEQTKSEKSILDALDRIKEVEDCIEVCPYCGQSLKGGNHVFRTSN